MPEFQRDPRNSIQDTIDNAIRGAYRRSALAQPGDGFFAPAVEVFFGHAARMVMEAFRLTDAPPTGVWVVLSGTRVDGLLAMYQDEIDAHRFVQQVGDFCRVKFVTWGEFDPFGEASDAAADA